MDIASRSWGAIPGFCGFWESGVCCGSFKSKYTFYMRR